MRIGGNHGALLMAHRSERGIRLALQRIEEVRVPVAHHPEDGIDVLGESQGDMCGDGGHGKAFRDRDGGGLIRMCLASRVVAESFVPLFRAPAACCRTLILYRARLCRNVASTP